MNYSTLSCVGNQCKTIQWNNIVFKEETNTFIKIYTVFNAELKAYQILCNLQNYSFFENLKLALVTLLQCLIKEKKNDCFS